MKAWLAGRLCSLIESTIYLALIYTVLYYVRALLLS